ncbi:MAG: PfkB family carbohydrate kinase [Clostridia bacterium]
MNKKILTIQDFSSVGRCSLTAALPILSACGQDVVALPTALLSTQTYGILGFTFTDLCDNMLPSYNHWKSLGIKFDCLYTGFLGSMETVDATIKIATDMKKCGALIAIDPAMAEDGALYKIFDNAYRDKMFELCKIADIVMPNFTEGKMLAGLDLTLLPNEDNANVILNILKTKGYKTVLLSGIKKYGEQGVALLHNGKITFYMNVGFDTFIHGAGDCLSSAFIGKLMSGSTMEEAAQAAVDYCKNTIEISLKEKVDLRFGLLIERSLPSLMK